MILIIYNCNWHNNFQINEKVDILCFYSTKYFTDSGLRNCGKSLEKLRALNSISLNFHS